MNDGLPLTSEAAPNSGGRKSTQFSLRTFVVFVSIVGAGLGLWQRKIAPIKRQWRAAEALFESGLKVETVPSGLPLWIESRVFEQGKSGYIESVDFSGKLMTKKDFDALRQLPRLKRLDMQTSPIDDESVSVLSELDALEFLNLHNTRCTWRAAWHFRDRPDIKVELTEWLYGFQEVLPGDAMKLAECNRDVSGVNLILATDARIEELVDTLPNLRRLNFVAQKDAISVSSIESILSLEQWRDVHIFFSVEKFHYLADDFKAYAGAASAVDFDLIKDISRIIGPKAQELRLQDRQGVYTITFVVRASDEITKEQTLSIVFEANELPVDFWGDLEGLDAIPRLVHIGEPQATPLAITKAMSGTKQLAFRPLEPIDDHVEAFSNLTNLESIVFEAPTYRFDVSIPDDFFSHLGCRESLRELMIPLEWDLSERQQDDLDDFPNLKR